MRFFRARMGQRDDPVAIAASRVMMVIEAAYRTAGMRIGESSDAFYAFNAGALDATDLARLWLVGRLRLLWGLAVGAVETPLGSRVQVDLRSRGDSLAITLVVDDQRVAEAVYRRSLDRLDAEPVMLVLGPGMLPHQVGILRVLSDVADMALARVTAAEVRRDLEEILRPGQSQWAAVRLSA